MRRGWPHAVILIAVAVTVSVGVYLTADKRQVVSSPPPSSSRVTIPSRQACAELERDYHEAWAEVLGCVSSDDCEVETRGQLWMGLDGCFRVGNARLPHRRADEIAQRWLTVGCASDYEICPSAPQAQCRGSRCRQKPPKGIPEEWQRVDILRTVTFWVPDDLAPQPARSDDTVVKVFEGPLLRVFADFGEWASDLELTRDAAADNADPDWLLVEEQELDVAGHRARRVSAVNRWTAFCDAGPCRFGRRFMVGVHIADIQYKWHLTALTRHPKLTLMAQCERMEHCAPFDAVVRSLAFW